MSDHYEIDQDGQIVTISVLSSDASHEKIQDAVDDCLDKTRYDNARHFVFDLEEVEYLASACIGVMVEFLREVEHVRGRICLANCQENVAFLFKVTQLDHIFEMFDDVEDAINELEGYGL